MGVARVYKEDSYLCLYKAKMSEITINLKTHNFLKNTELTPAFARIHAHISGDGYIQKTKSKRSKKELLEHPRINITRDRYYVRYVNMEKISVKQFIKDVKEVFNRKVVKLRKHEYEVCGKWIYNILKENGALKSDEWFIPHIIMNSNQIVKKEWLKAFFDDEGHVSRSAIYLKIVNKKGIMQVKKLLEEFKIKTRLYKPIIPQNPNYSISYRIGILGENIVKFSKYINFSYPKKKKQLSILVKKINGDAGTFIKPI